MSMFSLFPIMFGLVFIVVIGVFIMAFVKGISQQRRNAASPRLKVEALVVAKRSHVSRHSDHPATRYYATFEVESGDRMEFAMSGPDFGMLAEGDFGLLEFQGSDFVSFERT